MAAALEQAGVNTTLWVLAGSEKSSWNSTTFRIHPQPTDEQGLPAPA
jgi:hypothetical protein